MDLSKILEPTAVKVVGKLTSKKRLLQELAELAAVTYGLDVRRTMEALQERESLGPTGVGHGVALPHARIEGLDHVVGAFLRIESPMDFDAADRQPVDLVFALFAPEDSGVEHLKALALVSRTMRNTTTCSKLRANNDSVTLHALLTESPATKAA
ncbi:PTS sugar transporter subunit IIA [Candidatus Halocynthiibacter alkanivorans]|jgi:nitrogen PTS system EIIA component|uniref:PTS sugar transporter subunit IIA n=1 Tax=Candidatus Halocynthiibacter alkanivorans TaxID=2267619 RepID=UPI000DF2EBB2|nr:PTS sugar transporter subunit IIA [Candidatus Halocynthiibacter alkanivorans]